MATAIELLRPIREKLDEKDREIARLSAENLSLRTRVELKTSTIRSLRLDRPAEAR